MKKCSRCKLYKTLPEFNKTKSNKDGLSYVCRDCNLEVTRLYRKENGKQYYRNQQKTRSQKNHFISQTLYNCKTRARKKGLVFDICKEDIEERLEQTGYKCEISGEFMNFDCHSRKKANPRKCSVDRVDSTKGYTKGNIQLVCWAVNQMKSDRTEEEFKFWVETLYKAISSQASEEEGSTTIP